MELRDLRAFATLGELLHFGQAAERMHVTQSALSKQIQRLEGEFGGALFERGQAGTRLTPQVSLKWRRSRMHSCATWPFSPAYSVGKWSFRRALM